MALPFATQSDLETDLASKGGIIAVSSTLEDQVDAPEIGLTFYKIAVAVEHTDPDGTVRNLQAKQEIATDGTNWGYGGNRTWIPAPQVNTFTQDLKARIESLEGSATVGAATLEKAIILQNEPDRESAKVQGAFDDGTQKEAYMWKDSGGNWQQRIITG